MTQRQKKKTTTMTLHYAPKLTRCCGTCGWRKGSFCEYPLGNLPEAISFVEDNEVSDEVGTKCKVWSNGYTGRR